MDERKRIEGRKFVEQSHSILCSDVPDFIYEYASLPIVHRLAGVGLLCGTDWTKLYNNRFCRYTFYSFYNFFNRVRVCSET